MKRTAKLCFLFLILALMVLVAFLSVPRTTYAHAAQEEMTVTQSGSVAYGSKLYIGSTRNFVKFGTTDYNNELFDSLSFCLGNAELTIDPVDVRFATLTNVSDPGEYSDTVYVTYDEVVYETTVRFVIEKRTLIVSALINGQSSLTIKEGQNYSVSVVYEGFAGRDDEDVLDAPAIVTKYPKMPTEGYRIVPELAKSDLYSFEYRAATIVITSNPDKEKIYYEGDTVTLLLEGSFSPYYTLQYMDIGVSAASADYIAVSEAIDRYYGTSSMFDKYNKSDCFRANLYLDGNTVNLTETTTVRKALKIRLCGKENYLIIHLPEDGGEPKLLTGKESGGYLSFETVGLGTYLVLTPVEGVNIKWMIVIVVGILAVVALGIILVALFRSKL